MMIVSTMTGSMTMMAAAADSPLPEETPVSYAFDPEFAEMLPLLPTVAPDLADLDQLDLLAAEVMPHV